MLIFLPSVRVSLIGVLPTNTSRISAPTELAPKKPAAMNPILISLVLLVSLGTFSLLVYRKVALLGKLQAVDRVDRPKLRLRELLRIGFGQSKLIGRQRERASGAMHFFIFWGFVILGLRELLLIGEGFVPGFQEQLPLLGMHSIGAYLYVFVYNVFEVLVLAMVLIAFYRRLVLKPHRLTLNSEGLLILTMILGVVLTDLLYDAARYNLIQHYQLALPYLHSPHFGSEFAWAPFARALAWIGSDWGVYANAFFYHFGYWAHIGVVLTFLNLLPDSKHAHVITALPNVFFGSLGYPHQPAKLLDLEDETAWENEALGLNRIEQLSWKEGLDLYTCTECGRCYDICPTYVTHKPLTLKWVNESLRDHLDAEGDAIRKHGRSSGNQTLVGDIIPHDTLWACTTCRACEEVCPVSIEHVPRIIAMRQGQTLMHEAHPPELNSTYRGLERGGNPWGIAHDKREEWGGASFDMPPILTEPPTEDVEVILWVGCMAAFDARSQRIARATAQIFQRAGVSFAILGNAERCTGDLARRTGNELLYQTLARQNVETLNALQVKKLVTICPHCLNALKNEYPQLDGHYQVYHHSQFIQKLVEDGRLHIDPTLSGRVTFHDPCYLGRYQNEYDAPRNLLAAAAQETPVEMRRARQESFCCGAGGGRMWMEERIGTRVNEERVRQAKEIGAETIATGCPFCMTMISDGVNAQDDPIKVLDVAEIVLQATRPKEVSAPST